MKKVAGTLRIDLASYRELAAFSQFGSDLDDDTQRALNHGEKTVEILKQAAHHPIAVGKQVILIYALTHQFMVELKSEQVKLYEEKLYEYLDTNYSDLVKQIEIDGKLPDAEILNQLLSNFNEWFKVESQRG